jgi:hypothetical protein
MKKSTLPMVGIVAAVAILSDGLSLVPVQQASANFMEDGDTGDTRFSFEKIRVTNVLTLHAVLMKAY